MGYTCAAIKAGREEAAAHVVAVLEMDPGRELKPLCREIDPEGWMALESRVRRAQARLRRSEEDSSASPSLPTESQKGQIRGAKAAIRKHPELAAELLRDPQVAKALGSD